MMNHDSKQGMGKRLDNSSSRHHGRDDVCYEVCRLLLSEHHKTSACILFPLHQNHNQNCLGVSHVVMDLLKDAVLFPIFWNPLCLILTHEVGSSGHARLRSH